MKDILLQTEGLSKSFGGVVALNGVSLSVDANKITAVIGPNGAGKTTLFNLIAGVYAPTSGEILLGDRSLNSLSPEARVRLGIARTFQDVRLFANMTALENVMTGRHPRSRTGFFDAALRLPWSRREEEDIYLEAMRYLNLVGLGDKASEDALGIPFGQQKLVAIARAMATEPKLLMLEVGESPLGRRMYVCFISSAENIARLEELRDINERLALDPDIEDGERDGLIEDGKVFFLATLSMHSGEVGPTQSLPIIAHDLITSADPEVLGWLDDVVYMSTPCHNPDGMDMTVDHYRKYLGTKYDGASMPGLYHKYVGHDNNRDFVILSQKDTKVIAAIYSTIWYPQVMVEKHQMGSTGVRYFVPPNHDPRAENIDAGIWNWMGLFGMNMIKDMTKAGQAGVAQHYLFDEYWPGSTGTCNWKNVISFLTEAASVRYASPNGWPRRA